MKTVIHTQLPMMQEIEVSCNFYRACNAYLFNIYSVESYPQDKDRRPIAEELTLSFSNQEEVEQFIALVRKATKKVKPEKKETKASLSKK